MPSKDGEFKPGHKGGPGWPKGKRRKPELSEEPTRAGVLRMLWLELQRPSERAGAVAMLGKTILEAMPAPKLPDRTSEGVLEQLGATPAERLAWVRDVGIPALEAEVEGAH